MNRLFSCLTSQVHVFMFSGRAQGLWAGKKNSIFFFFYKDSVAHACSLVRSVLAAGGEVE